MSKQNPIRAHTATNFRYFSDRLLAITFCRRKQTARTSKAAARWKRMSGPR